MSNRATHQHGRQVNVSGASSLVGVVGLNLILRIVAHFSLTFVKWGGKFEVSLERSLISTRARFRGRILSFLTDRQSRSHSAV